MGIKLFRCKNCFSTRQDIERTAFVRPPKEANTNKIWELWNCIYGLADTSRCWYLKFREELIKLGAKPSQLDQGLFIWSIINKPVGIMACFVDDVLWGGNKNFIYIINKLKQTFHNGAEQGQAFNYIGIYLKLNDGFSTTINQIDYINSIHEIKVSDILERSKNDKLIEKEITSLRGALGKINWVAGMPRPEISYHVCNISTRVKNATIADIFTINKVIKFIKSTPSHITIPVMNLESLQLLLYSDASFNNLPDVGSQGGYMVFYATNSPIQHL